MIYLQHMKIHFFASGTSSGNAGKIMRILKKLGNQTVLEILEMKQKRSEADITSEKRAQVIIIETTSETPQLGFLMAAALIEKKPVLVLCPENSEIKDIQSLVGDKIFRYLTVASYNSKNIEKILKDYFKFLSDDNLSVRFNFFLSSDLENFLNWIPLGKKTPKSEFVRDLIRDAMDENEEYKAFIKNKKKK